VTDPTRVYLTPDQAAEYLHVSPGTLANWRTARKGPRFRRHTARTVVYVQSELDAWSASQSVDTVNEMPNAEAK
jgi:predicted DNA-binding transcriptional regulator AlpA